MSQLFTMMESLHLSWLLSTKESQIVPLTFSMHMNLQFSLNQISLHWALDLLDKSEDFRFILLRLSNLTHIIVYSPIFLEFIETKIAPCDSTTCSLSIGYSVPPTCFSAVCNTPSTYTSFGTCESMLFLLKKFLSTI